MTTLTGGCLCGAIRYTISAPVPALRACHCLKRHPENLPPPPPKAP